MVDSLRSADTIFRGDRYYVALPSPQIRESSRRYGNSITLLESYGE